MLLKILKYLLKGILRWYSVFLIIASFVATYFLFNHFHLDKPDFNDSLKDKIELISWIYAGVMGLVSFLSVFVAFIYDNKLITASKTLKQILHPYDTSLGQLRTAVAEYERSVSNSLTIHFIYWLLLITSLTSIILWGIAVLSYNNFNVKFPSLSSLEEIINFSLYIVWGLLCILLISLTIIINTIRNNKDPLAKGYLPKAKDVLNLKYLAGLSDFAEIIKVISPKIVLFRNPMASCDIERKYEMNLTLPLNISYLNFLIKLYDSNDRLFIRFYGKTSEINILGEKLIKVIPSIDIDDEIFGKLESEMINGEFRVYDEGNDIISRFTIRTVRSTDNQIDIQIHNDISHIVPDNDIDYSLVSNLKENEYCSQREILIDKESA